ncbi:unnamed protein product, partial [Rotaria magnacalcarata]
MIQVIFIDLLEIIDIDYDRNDSYRYDTLWDRYIYIYIKIQL